MKYTRLSLLLILSIILMSVTLPDQLIIAGVKGSYCIKDTVSLTVTNIGDEKIYTSVNLEKLVDKSWRLVKDDIYSCMSCGTFHFFSFEPGETHKIVWLTSKIELISGERLLPGQYRIVLKWYSERSKKDIYTRSELFYFKK